MLYLDVYIKYSKVRSVSQIFQMDWVNGLIKKRKNKLIVSVFFELPMQGGIYFRNNSRLLFLKLISTDRLLLKNTSQSISHLSFRSMKR